MIIQKYMLACLLLISTVVCQSDEEKEELGPCENPILQKARGEGLNSLSFKEIPKFWIMSFLCKRDAKKRGENVDFRDLHQQKQQENFEEARKLSGVGTCCLTVTILILFYSYFGLVMGAD